MASSFRDKCRGKLLPEDEKKIQDNWCALKEHIECDPNILIDRFYQISLIDTKEKRGFQECDEKKKAEGLLNIVMDSGPDGYKRFLECLKLEGFTGAVKLLEPECCSGGDYVAEYIEKTGNEREIRVVLIGKTGVGKSSLGNTLLHLIGDDKFVSDVGAGSITESNLLKERVTRIDKENILLKVLDTPGLSDTRKSNTETATDLVRCIDDLNPGPHVFVFVFKIDRIDDFRERLDLETKEKNRVERELKDQANRQKREKEQLKKEKESLQKRLKDIVKLKEENKTLKDNYQQLVKEHEQSKSLKNENQNLGDENMALKLDKVYQTESTIKSYVEVLKTSGHLKNLDLVELCDQLLSRGYLDANDKSEVIESKTPIDTIDKLMKILKTKDRNQNVEAYIVIVKYLGNEMPNLKNNYASPFDSNEQDDTNNSDNTSHHDDSHIIKRDDDTIAKSDTSTINDTVGSPDSTSTHDTIDANDTIENTSIVENTRDSEYAGNVPHPDSPLANEYARHFPLHYAALDCTDLDSFGSVLTVYNDKIHSRDEDGYTPLEKAGQSPRFMVDKVKLLLLEGYGKAKPLLKLIETAPTDLLELIFNMRSDNNKIKDFDLTIAELRQLLEKGCDIKSKTRKTIRNRSLLHAACALASLESVRYLIDEGCDVNRRDSEGLSPLCHCCWFDIDPIRKVKLLITRGSRYNKIDAVSLCNNATMRFGEGSNTVINLRRIFGIK